MCTDQDDDLDEFCLQLSRAGIRPGAKLLHAALLDFSDMKQHIVRVNEAIARYAPLETSGSPSAEVTSK